MLNIYLLTKTITQGHDTFNALVVVAENEQQARKIRPQHGGLNEWPNVSCIEVTLLGEANPTFTEECIILADFNAG